MKVTITLETYQAQAAAAKLSELIKRADELGELNQMQWDGLTTIRDMLNLALSDKANK